MRVLCGKLWKVARMYWNYMPPIDTVIQYSKFIQHTTMQSLILLTLIYILLVAVLVSPLRLPFRRVDVPKLLVVPKLPPPSFLGPALAASLVLFPPPPSSISSIQANRNPVANSIVYPNQFIGIQRAEASDGKKIGLCLLGKEIYWYIYIMMTHDTTHA